MGTKDFTEDYIKYLERHNANLQNQSIRFKEFGTRLLNKELRNKQYELAVEDITNICRSTCEAIDKYFHHFNAAMDSLKNVLMWKSQVLQIPERLTMALSPDINEVSHKSVVSNSDSGLINVNDSNQNKKGGTAKVCPMIRGHVISAPRIHLNRLNEDVGPQSRRPLATPLSPIIEQSPGRSPDETSRTSSPEFRNIQIPLHRLRIENLEKKSESEDCCKTNASPKINFTRRKCPGFELRKRYSSMGISERFRMMRERRIEIINGSKHDEEVSEDGDVINEENPNYTTEISENTDTDGQNIPQDIDPLEGPSWLLDKQPRSEGSDSGLSSMQCRFVNFRRLNHRSNRLLSGEDSQQKRDVLNINDDAQMGNFELDHSHSDNLANNSFPAEEKASEINAVSENEESSSSENSCSLSNDILGPQEYEKFDDSDTRRPNADCLPFKYPKARCSLERKSIHYTEDSSMLNTEKPVLRSSTINRYKLSNERDFSNSEKKNSELDLFNCSVNLEKLPTRVSMSRPSETPKRSRLSERELEVSRDRKRCSSKTVTPPSTVPVRIKRRAAEQCIINKVWVDTTPRWEAKIKQQARDGRRGKRKDPKNKNSKAKKCDKNK